MFAALPTEPVASAVPFATAAVPVATATLAAPAKNSAPAPVVEYISRTSCVLCCTSARRRVHRASTSGVPCCTSARRRVHRARSRSVLCCTRARRRIRRARSRSVRGASACCGVRCSCASRDHIDLVPSTCL